MDVILASASPRRKELLEKAGLFLRKNRRGEEKKYPVRFQKK